MTNGGRGEKGLLLMCDMPEQFKIFFIMLFTAYSRFCVLTKPL